MRILVCASLLIPMLALAEPKSADDWYKEGETEYNLGNFEKAADAFKQGFSFETNDSKKPAYLYNVAQAYRQGNKCKDAAFFYKRYLSLKDQDTVKPLKAETRSEIEQRINELEECAKNQEAIAKKPPDDTMHPTDSGKGSGSAKPTSTGSGSSSGSGSGSGSATRVAQGSDDGSDDEGSANVTVTPTSSPKVLSARFIGGASKIGAGDLTVPLQATFTLIAGYPLMLNDKLELDLGVAASFTPVPYINTMTNAKESASFLSALADAGATYTVAPKIGIRGDLGLGALIFNGITDQGNPFTMNGAATTGALTMFALRVAASVDYSITQNLLVTLVPIAFTYSPAASGLKNSSFTRLDFMLGVGYRM